MISVIVNDGVAGGFDAFLAEALLAAGMPVTLGSVLEAPMTQATARAELRALLEECACASGDDELCTSPELTRCVEGSSVRSQPAGAAAALADAADRGGAVMLEAGRDGATRELRCPPLDRPHRRLLALEGGATGSR
jgi:hypothetical protein